MSYDQVARAFGGDDASSGRVSQGSKGIRRAFWFSHSAFWNLHSEFRCAKWVRRPLIISHSTLVDQIFAHDFLHRVCDLLLLLLLLFCSAKISQSVRKFMSARCAKVLHPMRNEP